MVALKLFGVTCTYSSIKALENVTLEFDAGEVYGIIGPNGAGKTTLLRCIARLLRPKTGVVYLDGEDLWKLRLREVAKKIAYSSVELPQGFNVTVEEFLLTSRYPYSNGFWENERDLKVVEEALIEVNALNYVKRKLTQLSSGEVQRVLMAKLLAREAKILLLDEPTVHLDIKYQFDILSLIRRITKRRQTITIMALHDLMLASTFCDKLILLSNGKVVAVGRPDEVITEKNIFKVYGVQVKVLHDPEIGILVVPYKQMFRGKVS